MAQTIGNIIDAYDRKESVSVYLREDVEHICQLAQVVAFQRAAEVARKLAGEIENSAGVNSLPYSEQVREMSDALSNLQPE